MPWTVCGFLVFSIFAANSCGVSAICLTSVTACRDPNCAQFAEVGLIETCEPTACECLCSDADQAQGTKPIWVDSSPVNVVSARLSSVHILHGLDVDLKLNDPDSGFFLRPFRSADDDSTIHEEHLVSVRRGSVGVTASWGPFQAHANITPAAELHGNETTADVHTAGTQRLGGMHVSAHLVTHVVTLERPRLQTLFHGLTRHGFTARDLQPNGLHPGGGKNGGAGFSRICVQMRVRKDEDELTAVCLISRASPVCIAELTLPRSWWGSGTHAQSAQVWYSLYPVERSLQCNSASNIVVPGQRKWGGAPRHAWVGSAVLEQARAAWRVIKEDQHVLVFVPQRNFFPGSKFRVPVKLQAQSDLKLFAVRVKARNGLRILGAEGLQPDTWHTTVDLNPKKRTAMATADLLKSDSKLNSEIQPIFEWIFEVDAKVDNDPGRITFSLEYELNSGMKEKYGTVANKVVARINIQHDNTFDIVPVMKYKELVNTAILTGRQLTWPLRIFSVSQAGKVSDITSQSTCHSGDDHVIKVSPGCNQVYLDGTETRGSSSINVIAKYGRHTKFLFLRVWIPEIPLKLTLSDERLSQIKRWRAPKHRKRSRATRSYVATNAAKTEASDDDEDIYTTTCNLRYQQAQVQVYARFYTPDGSHSKIYLAHRKALMRVTDLVMERLRVADTSVATISKNVVDGLKPGRTEVQVLSRLGRVNGARELRVSKSRVSIKRLRVDVVTGLSVGMTSPGELPGTLVARVARREMLGRKYQEGILDVSVEFSDKTSMELEHVPPSDYFLDMDTLNNHVIAFGPMMSPDRPRVIALGQGNGELLKLSMELGDVCARKNSKALAVSYVYVNVNFDGDDQNQDSIKTLHGPLQTIEKDDVDKNGYALNKQDVMPAGVNGAEFPQGDQPFLNDAEAPSGGENRRSQTVLYCRATGSASSAALNAQNGLVVARSFSALEMGMYILAAIFCVAIVIFAANCLLYVYRYRRKQSTGNERWTGGGAAGDVTGGGSHHGGTEPVSQQAAEWVWIGRSTLERNAVNTACAQTLLPDEDFNGNRHSVHSSQLGEEETKLTTPGSSEHSSNRSSAIVDDHSATQRQSVISTYRGSECCVRITSNPLAGDDAPPPVPPRGARSPRSPRALPSSPLTLNNLPPALVEEERESSDDEYSAMSEDDDDDAGCHTNGGSRDDELAALTSSHASLTSINNGYHSDRGTGYHSDPGHTSDGTVRFDSEALGMTYTELMQYFDNLKESTA